MECTYCKTVIKDTEQYREENNAFIPEKGGALKMHLECYEDRQLRWRKKNANTLIAFKILDKKFISKEE